MTFITEFYNEPDASFYAGPNIEAGSHDEAGRKATLLGVVCLGVLIAEIPCSESSNGPVAANEVSVMSNPIASETEYCKTCGHMSHLAGECPGGFRCGCGDTSAENSTPTSDPSGKGAEDFQQWVIRTQGEAVYEDHCGTAVDQIAEAYAASLRQQLRDSEQKHSRDMNAMKGAFDSLSHTAEAWKTATETARVERDIARSGSEAEWVLRLKAEKQIAELTVEKDGWEGKFELLNSFYASRADETEDEMLSKATRELVTTQLELEGKQAELTEAKTQVEEQSFELGRLQGKVGQLEAERAAFIERTRLAEAVQVSISESLDCVLLEKPLPNGEYVHHVYCNGSRKVPAGTPGHSCCCLRSVAALTSQVSVLTKERDELKADNAKLLASNKYCSETVIGDMLESAVGTMEANQRAELAESRLSAVSEVVRTAQESVEALRHVASALTHDASRPNTVVELRNLADASQAALTNYEKAQQNILNTDVAKQEEA